MNGTIRAPVLVAPGLTTRIVNLEARATALETAKADKAGSPTAGNFAGLDAGGNLTDSGFTNADYSRNVDAGTPTSVYGGCRHIDGGGP